MKGDCEEIKGNQEESERKGGKGEKEKGERRQDLKEKKGISKFNGRYKGRYQRSS